MPAPDNQKETEVADEYKLDELDLAIVEALGDNGRLSPSEIATRIGDISERTVRSRLAAMIENKLIYVGAMPDPSAVGASVLADVTIDVEPGKVSEVANRLVDFECINYVAITSGGQAIAMAMSAATNLELLEFVDTVIGKIPGVRATNVVILLSILKTFGWKTKSAEKLRAKLQNQP
ncbi:hypothetical protein CH06BL_16410 [Chromobacterium haemolyticum]|nr:hypothetical protein CH06BL_16410 [Chromobacterium haemolyticum]